MNLLSPVALLPAAFLSAYAATAPTPNALGVPVGDRNRWVGDFGRNPPTKTGSIDRLATMGL